MFKFFLSKVFLKKKGSVIGKELTQGDALFILSNIAYRLIRGPLFHFASPLKTNLYGKGITINCRRMLHIGKKCIIGDFVTLSCYGKNGITLGDSVSIGDFSKFIVSSDFTNLGKGIELENGVGIGEYSRIGGSGGVIIGENTIIGQYFSCHPENHVFSSISEPIKAQGTKRAKIVIGKGGWVGSKVTVLAGSTIGDNCVIAAGAVVNGQFPSHCVIGGVPAKIIKILGSTDAI